MPAISELIATTAQDLIASLADAGVQLDSSPASLELLDEVIDAIWSGAAPADDMFDGMVWGYGCYVADVIQRHHAGEWVRSEFDGYDFVGPDGESCVNPWHWVERRFQLGDLLAPQYRAVVVVLTAR